MHSFRNRRQLCPISSDQQDMLYSVCGQSIQAWSICVTAAADHLPGEQGTQVEQQQVLLCSAAHPFCPAADSWMTTERRAPTAAPSYGIVMPLSAEEADREYQNKTVTARGTLAPTVPCQESQPDQDI